MEQQGTSTPGGVTASDPMPGTSAKEPSAAPGALDENPRGEVPGCPTGLAGLQPARPAQKQGAEAGPMTRPPYSPGEGVTEEQQRRSGTKG